MSKFKSNDQLLQEAEIQLKNAIRQLPMWSFCFFKAQHLIKGLFKLWHLEWQVKRKLLWFKALAILTSMSLIIVTIINLFLINQNDLSFLIISIVFYLTSISFLLFLDARIVYFEFIVQYVLKKNETHR